MEGSAYEPSGKSRVSGFLSSGRTVVTVWNHQGVVGWQEGPRARVWGPSGVHWVDWAGSPLQVRGWAQDARVALSPKDLRVSVLLWITKKNLSHVAMLSSLKQHARVLTKLFRWNELFWRCFVLYLIRFINTAEVPVANDETGTDSIFGGTSWRRPWFSARGEDSCQQKRSRESPPEVITFANLLATNPPHSLESIKCLPFPEATRSLERGKNNTHFDNSRPQAGCKGVPPLITEELPARSEIIDPVENARSGAEREEVKQ